MQPLARAIFGVSLTISVALCSPPVSGAQDCPDPIPQDLKGGQMIACLKTIQQQLRSLTAAIPKNAVLAFDRTERDGGACPEGWSLFRPAGGRFIVGAGQHDNKDANGKSLTFRPAYSSGVDKAIGGEEEHVLTMAEMPRHSHRSGLYTGDRWLNPNSPGTSLRMQYAHDGTGNPYFSTDAVGEGRAHNNMPPFVALYFCRKN